jgi:Protein of unknown function (DUF1223)
VSYFMFFDSATQLRSVDHFAKQAGSADVRKLLYLEAHGGRLERTVKTDQIVTGPFGAVIAEKTCFYNRPDPSWISVRIQSLNPEIGREIPGPVPEAPKIIPPLASISIVRFFRTDPQLIFGSGNYEADGTSEGCSSCPPADQLLARIQKADPNVIVLSEHVWHRAWSAIWPHHFWSNRDFVALDSGT